MLRGPRWRDDPAEDPGLLLDLPDGGQIGSAYVREEHGDWELRCIRSADGNDPCQLYQLLSDAEGNAVAEFALFPLPVAQGDAVAGGTVITPLETLLPEQVTLAVDGADARRYPFTFCTEIGCIARVGFTAEDIDRFRRSLDHGWNLAGGVRLVFSPRRFGGRVFPDGFR
jgi:invasion protein IalB